ncbi:TonB family protein [bacterium]|nr:TonB family protein [bacterium]
MSGSQKLILYVEIVLIIVGLGVFLFAPSKKADLKPYYDEFIEYEDLYNLLSGLNYKIVTNDLQNLIPMHEEIKKILDTNDPKTEIEPLIKKTNEYKRLLDNVNNHSKIYKALMNKFAEAMEKLKTFSEENGNSIKKFEEIRLKVSTSETMISSLWANAKKAVSMDELSSIQSKLTKQLGIIDSFPLLLSRENDKLKYKEAAKKQAIQMKNTLKKKQANTRKKEEKIAKKKAEEKRIAEEKEQEVTYFPPKLLKKAEPDYPDRWRTRGVGGKVKIKVSIAANGHVKSVKLLRSTGNDTLDKNAYNAAKECLFIPAKEGDKTVESEYILQYEFIAD